MRREERHGCGGGGLEREGMLSEVGVVMRNQRVESLPTNKAELDCGYPLGFQSVKLIALMESRIPGSQKT